MQEELDSFEFAEWLAYYQLEPFGEERSDLRAGIITSAIANANRDPKKRSRAYTPGDFMPDFGRVKVAQTMEDQIALAKMITMALGGVDLREKK
ncbi:hypothetical protein ES705_07274 [subsurface metagenome]